MPKSIARYVVRLTPEERAYLISLTSKGTIAASMLKHARILLLSDREGDWKKDAEIAALEHVALSTLTDVRRRFVEEGLEASLNRKPHIRTKPRKLGGEEEAKLIAVCCSKAPEGRSRWTIRLLTERCIELQIVESIGRETIRSTLKKTNLNLGLRKSGASRPKKMPNSSAAWKTS